MSKMSKISTNSDHPTASLSSLGFRLCVDTITHPLEYAKFLIQIGHEPLPAYPTRSLLGRPTMCLPNCFKYVQYIKSIDGWAGCYRGCVPKLIGRAIGSGAANAAVKCLESSQKGSLTEDMELSDDEKITMLKTTVIKDVIGRTCLVIVSHPFLVISNRMMASFVGGEDSYSGFFSTIAAIFREQGISGFFSGVMPRWVGELIYIGISSLLIYGINNYMITDKEVKTFTGPVVNYLSSVVAYQFFVVSSCMSVNNCGLQAGIPPNMPIYKSWWSCRQHLSSCSQLNRGSSLILRYYMGPPAGQKAFVSY